MIRLTSALANSSYELYNDLWEALDGGPCPAGHYCPSGTEDPQQCLNASVRSEQMGVPRCAPYSRYVLFGKESVGIYALRIFFAFFHEQSKLCLGGLMCSRVVYQRFFATTPGARFRA